MTAASAAGLSPPSSPPSEDPDKGRPRVKMHQQVDSRVFFISGVSLGIPPWPSNLTLSLAVLQHPVNMRRLGESTGLHDLRDRKRRVYVNLVILFRLVTHCQHLAFDTEAFWTFVRSAWACGPSAQQTEYLVKTYSDRRVTYIRSKKIVRKHYDLLTDLIDAWNSRDEDLPVSAWPSREVIRSEWAAVKASWNEQVDRDFRSLVDEYNPPTIGTFSVDRGTPSTFRIKGEGSRVRESKEPEPTQDSLPLSFEKKETDSMPAAIESLSPKAFEKAVDELIETQGQKRKVESNSPSPTKRLCVPEVPPSSHQWSSPSTGSTPKPFTEPETAVEKNEKHDADAMRNAEQLAPVESQEAKACEQQAGLAQQDKLVPAVAAQPAHEEDPIKPIELEVSMQDEKLHSLHEQVTLLVESEQLSRQIQKAHNDLTMFTASQCENTLEKLDAISSGLSTLNDEVATCRQTSQETQQLQQKQQELDAEHRNRLESDIEALKSESNTLKVIQEQQKLDLEHRNQLESDMAALKSESSALKVIQEQQQQNHERHENRLKTMDDRHRFVTTALHSLKILHQKNEEGREVVERRLSKLESSWATKQDDQQKSSPALEQRLKKMEDAILTSTTLIDQCRTLVEVTKTSLDQQFSSLDSRFRVLEQRFGNHLAEQERASKEQAKRMDQLEAELKMCKATPSVHQDSRPRRPPLGELADLQTQLNTLKNSLAAVVRHGRLGLTEGTPGAPIIRASQESNNHPPTQRQKEVSSCSVPGPSPSPATAPLKSET